MKRTTLALDERLLARLRARARREGKQVQECANELLRLGLQAVEATGPPATGLELPVFSLGEPRVDVADREALHDLLDEG
jgi:hypothetical protein